MRNATRWTRCYFVWIAQNADCAECDEIDEIMRNAEQDEMDEVMDESDCAECELCGMRLCGIRIVQNATRLVRLCGMQRDGEKYRLC